MERLDGWEILDSAPVAEETAVAEHLAGFVNSFVEKDRRDRWLHLLLKRPQQIYGNSHKLYGHLDKSNCSLLPSESPIPPKSKGVYYGFSDEPVVLTASDAFVVNQGRDAIFSIVPGKLAIYFFHEDEIWLCKA